MEIIYHSCREVDVHKKSISACHGESEANKEVLPEVKIFGTMTKDLLSLSDWQKAKGVTYVALGHTILIICYIDIQNKKVPVLMLTPTNWDQKHTFNAQLIYQISDWTFSLIGRYGSGKPYTPSFPVGESGTETRGQLTNSERLPAQRGLDLTISKLFMLSGLRLELFLNVYNLLDLRDANSVYTDTGSAEYTTTIDPSSLAYNSYNPNRVSTVQDFVLRPANFTGPRQVQLGLTLGF
jgi:hypothetical protein